MESACGPNLPLAELCFNFQVSTSQCKQSFYYTETRALHYKVHLEPWYPMISYLTLSYDIMYQ